MNKTEIISGLYGTFVCNTMGEKFIRGEHHDICSVYLPKGRYDVHLKDDIYDLIKEHKVVRSTTQVGVVNALDGHFTIGQNEFNGKPCTLVVYTLNNWRGKVIGLRVVKLPIEQ